jgi:hypothetical protein
MITTLLLSLFTDYTLLDTSKDVFNLPQVETLSELPPLECIEQCAPDSTVGAGSRAA